MKNLILFLFCSFSVSLFAQSQNSPLEKAADKVIKMYEMDNSQAAQYLQILKTKAEAISKIKEPKNLTNNKEMAQIQETYEDAFLLLLTDKQKEIFKIHNQIAQNAIDRTPQSASNLQKQ